MAPTPQPSLPTDPAARKRILRAEAVSLLNRLSHAEGERDLAAQRARAIAARLATIDAELLAIIDAELIGRDA